MMDFLLIWAALCVICYPIHGACVYGDAWTWVFKQTPTIPGAAP